MIHKVINPVRSVRHNSLPNQYKKNKSSTNNCIGVSKITPYISYRNLSNSLINKKKSNTKLKKIIKTGISSFENSDQVSNEQFIIEEKMPIIVTLNDNEIINKESYKEKKKIIKKFKTVFIRINKRKQIYHKKRAEDILKKVTIEVTLNEDTEYILQIPAKTVK